jgi:hypothetical protein
MFNKWPCINIAIDKWNTRGRHRPEIREYSARRIPRNILWAASSDKSQRSTSDNVRAAADMRKCCALRVRWVDERRVFLGLCRTFPRADVTRGQCHRDGQSAIVQNRLRQGRNRASRRDAARSARLQPRPEPDRTAFTKLKAALRKAAAQTSETPIKVIAQALPDFTPQASITWQIQDIARYAS